MKIQKSLVYDLDCPISECKTKINLNVMMQVSTDEMIEKYNTYSRSLSSIKNNKN